MKPLEAKDYIGKRYGRWVVIDLLPPDSKGRKVKAICDCGIEKTVNLSSLKNGETRSCGCYLREQASEAHKIHGMTKTTEHTIWSSMIARCTNPSSEAYSYYGGRGITVCDRWKNSFLAFIEDMGLRPSPKHSIDRIDDNGNYEPGNCRWATPKEQARNRKSNRYLTYQGETLTLAEWAERTGINKNTIYYRLSHGWDVEKILEAYP